MMGFKFALSGMLVGSALLMGTASVQAATEVEFWHAMSGELGARVEETVQKFNDSQDKYVVRAVAKGTYDEVVNGMIAAYRADLQPAIVQVNERAFLTMLYSDAILPVADLMEQKGYEIDWSSFIAPVASYYSKDERLQAMPFNSSTPILFFNQDHFTQAGFEAPGKTWQELEAQLQAIHDKGISKCAMVLPGDYEWSFLENYSAINDLPYGTGRNGFDGLNTEFVFNQHLGGQVERMQRLISSGVMEIAGQGVVPVQLFTSGTCSTIVASTASHAAVEANSQFKWSATYLPYEEGVEPRNSVIGGGALWTLKGHSDEEYDAVAAFFDFLAKPETQVEWSKGTGYVPVTTTAYEMAKAEGYYDSHPTREIAVVQLSRGTPTDNSLGFRFGNSNQINVAIKEEVQAAMLGQKPVQEALDAAVARGNEVLRRYEQLQGGK